MAGQEEKLLTIDEWIALPDGISDKEVPEYGDGVFKNGHDPEFARKVQDVHLGKIIVEWVRMSLRKR